jgi:hypothetical protein
VEVKRISTKSNLALDFNSSNPSGVDKAFRRSEITLLANWIQTKKEKFLESIDSKLLCIGGENKNGKEKKKGKTYIMNGIT